MRRRYRIVLDLELMEDKDPERFDWVELLGLENNEYIDIIDIEKEDDEFTKSFW